jgi:Fe-S-cluster containining protein
MERAPKPLLPVPPAALEIHDSIVDKLREILALKCTSCLDQGFRTRLDSILDCLEHYQQVVIDTAGLERSCYKGCGNCCFHWVEDVNSFEAEIIADTVRRFPPQDIVRILAVAAEDARQMESLDTIVEEKYASEGADISEEIDRIDLLLSSFYQLKRPCPLLDKNGTCLVYAVRPLTCRVYMSFSEVWRCSPDYINDGDVPTYLLDMEESANMLLDELHFKFLRYNEDTGLRSLLVKYLTEKR